MIIRFAYPNVKAGRFIGCSRYAVFPSDERLAGYVIADPQSVKLTEVTESASILAPKSSETGRIVHETKDRPEHRYIGDSLDLAYLLALVSRSEKVRPDMPADIWCTGRIDLVGEDPILKRVDPAGFGTKLDAFLSEENSDWLFVVPDSNLQQKLGVDLDTREDVAAFTLKQFRKCRSPSLFERKTIIKVRRHELRPLVDILFQGPGMARCLRNLFPFGRLGSLGCQGLRPLLLKSALILMLISLPLIGYQVIGITPPKPGKQRDSLTGMTFVRIPGGCYEMGCGDWTDDCSEYEFPVHRICVDDFWMGQTEVTRGQWKSLMADQPEWRELMERYPSAFGRDADHPATMLSWHDANAFVSALAERTGSSCRLPTEAEWEHACRSGGQPEKYAGGRSLERLAWYQANSLGTVHPVGRKAPNGLGLHDMSGNVKEWCSDMYRADAYRKHSEENPLMTDGTGRVARGGSWSGSPRFIRCGYRFGAPPDTRANDIGFRVVKIE